MLLISNRNIQLTYFDQFVSGSGNSQWLTGRTQSNSFDGGDPVGVTHQGNQTFTLNVPDFDGFISGSSNNLVQSFVERNRQNIGFVTNKGGGTFTGSQRPQFDGFIPRSRESVVAVSSQKDIFDNVVVTFERFNWDTVLLVVTSQLPGDQSFISGSRNQ